MVKSLLPVGSAQLSDDTPQALGTAASGSGSTASRADHVHPMPNRARGAYDAIVYIQDGDVIAEDATGDEISSGTAGTDDADIINAAIDYCNNSGSVTLFSGTYYLSKTINLDAGVALIAADVPLYAPADVGIVELRQAENFSGTELLSMGTTSMLQGLKLRGLYDKTIITANQITSIRNCYVFDGSRGIDVTDCGNVQIIGGSIGYNHGHGIYAGYGFVDSYVFGSYIYGNYYNGIYTGSGSGKNTYYLLTIEWNSYEGIKSYRGFDDNISRCQLDRNGKPGIYLQEVKRASVFGNNFRRNCAISGNAHILVGSNCSDIQLGSNFYAKMVVNDDGTGAIKPDYVYEIGSNVTIDYYENPTAQAVGIHKNANRLKQNSGSSTGTGSEQTIAHDLVAAPSKVAIVPTETGATVGAVWADGTNIYCTVTTGKAFNWSAEV